MGWILWNHYANGGLFPGASFLVKQERIIASIQICWIQFYIKDLLTI